MTKIKINPKILRWAREESGYLEKDISFKLNIDLNRYLQWEKTGEDIPFGKLKILAKTFKRQIATFFLPKIPPKIKKPKDFRNLLLVNTPLSKDTLLSIRRVCRYQKLMLELFGSKYFQYKYKWFDEYREKFQNSSDSDQIACWFRKKLKYTIEDQINEKSNEIAYKKWRNLFENKLTIFVFQFSMPTDEIQGFSYSDEYPICIAINSKNYSTNSRIFTLFHEFAHSLKNQSSLCIPNTVTEEQHEEYKINSLAGSLLLPRNYVTSTTDPDEIYKYSKKYKVSSEVYLRRLKDLNLISDDKFFELLDLIREKVKLPKKGSFPVSPLQKSINARGQLFYDSVISAARNEVITYSRAADILGIKVNYFLSE